MKFFQLLEQYMKTLDCTGKELSELSGISSSVISRYKTGEREPAPNSETLVALVKALSKIANSKQMEDMSEEIIMSRFLETLLSHTMDYANFINNFNILYDKLNLSMKNISSYTNYDVSFLYRVKSGERKISDPIDFSNKLASYLVDVFSSYGDKEIVAGLIGVAYHDISDASDYHDAIYYWLLADTNEIPAPNHKPKHVADISSFLTKLDGFNLDDYIKVIHFDELKVPTIPFHLPTTKIYNGIQQMREGELDFFKATVTSKSAKSILMCANMPMLDMAEDIDFNKKWMFAIACSLKKGLHIDMIHYLERPFEELLFGLEAWIPIYMTGQVSPYYLPNYVAHIYHNLDYISEVAALHGECIADGHDEGRYILSNNKEELAYYQKRRKRLLTHAKPLMEIYNNQNVDEFHKFLQTDASAVGHRRNILSSLPIYTISETLLDDILISNHIADSDAETIKNYRKSEIERIKQKLMHSTITDNLHIPSEAAYQENPMLLSVSGCFYESPIAYEYKQLLAHLKETQEFAASNPNYVLNTNELTAFRNIQIEIMEDEYVIISKIKSPSIHFIIRHPRMINALQNFTIPVIEK